MQKVNSFLLTINDYLGGHWWFVYLLLLTGVFFTIYLGFPQIRYFGHALKVVRGRFDRKGDIGDTTPFPGAYHGALGHGRNGQHRRGGPGDPPGRTGGTVLDVGDGCFWDVYEIC